MTSAPEKVTSARSLLGAFYTIPVLFTSGCLLGFVYEAYTAYFRYHCGILTPGTVQGVWDEGNTDGDWTSCYVSFKTSDGQTFQITNHYNTSGNPKIYRLGQSVQVVYNAQDPASGRIDNGREKYGVVIGTFLLTVLGLSVALSIFFEQSYLPSPR